jgi:glutamate formiminotransferase/formiminotetrahydrofolate cyclodeaminase
MTQPEWKPDFGPFEFIPKFGCVITGARFFLVAYNVNLRTKDVDTTHDIALHIREMGWPLKNDKGEELVNSSEKKIFHPGALLNAKGMGVYLDKDEFCQVSINLTNYLITGPHIAFEQVKAEAKSRGIEVNGSEVVGLIPLEALLLASEYYIWRDELDRPATMADAVRIVHDKMELSSYNQFDPAKKIIEYAIQN